MCFVKLKPYRDTKGRLWVTEEMLRRRFRKVFKMCEKEPIFVSRDTPGPDLVLMTIAEYCKMKAIKDYILHTLEGTQKKEEQTTE